MACVDEEHLVATFDRDTLPTSISADAFQLSKVLTSFQTSLDEVTLLARPEGNSNMQPIQLASYVPPAKRAPLLTTFQPPLQQLPMSMSNERPSCSRACLHPASTLTVQLCV